MGSSVTGHQQDVPRTTWQAPLCCVLQERKAPRQTRDAPGGVHRKALNAQETLGRNYWNERFVFTEKQQNTVSTLPSLPTRLQAGPRAEEGRGRRAVQQQQNLGEAHGHGSRHSGHRHYGRNFASARLWYLKDGIKVDNNSVKNFKLSPVATSPQYKIHAVLSENCLSRL